MNPTSRVTLHPAAAAAAGLALLSVGAGAAYVLLRNVDGNQEHKAAAAGAALSIHAAHEPGSAAAPPPPTRQDPGAPLPDVTITLTPEAVARAGIVARPVEAGTTVSAIRLPGVVEPNAYRQVLVTPLVSGRVTGVRAQLGDRVRRGGTLAEIYSPELAEAQTRYLSVRARLDAHARELRRTEKLLEIGAASRQELERVHADHVAHIAELETARTRLELLGMPGSTIDALDGATPVRATISVPAPIDGVVLAREANVGLNVDPAMALFTVVDLSSVWVVADVYERDLARVREGGAATVVTTAYPGEALHGRVSYIDPQVSPATRTARVRVEIPNPRGHLRLGMYAEVRLEGGAGAASLVLPRSAVQKVGDRDVVYVIDARAPGTFVEREVSLGRPGDGHYEVLSGVRFGDRVVVEGSFFLRAERERLGLRPPQAAASATGRASSDTPGAAQTVNVVVNAQGYQPSRVRVRSGAATRIAFVRTTDETCGTEVVVPSLDIRRPLPLNEPVVIEVAAASRGEIAFLCGMGMLRGAVVVE